MYGTRHWWAFLLEAVFGRPEEREPEEFPRSTVAYGFVALPFLVAIEYLWLVLLFEGDIEWDPLVVLVWAAPVGLAFWYAAGLPWSALAGCAGSALGALALVLVMALLIASDLADLGGRLGGVLTVAIPAAILGIVAYPFGVLARSVIRYFPLLGVIWGGSLLALAGLGLLVAREPDALPSDEDAGLLFALVAVAAPASLFGGVATLLVSVTAAKRRFDVLRARSR